MYPCKYSSDKVIDCVEKSCSVVKYIVVLSCAWVVGGVGGSGGVGGFWFGLF